MGNLSTFAKNWKLRIIAKKILRNFWELHSDSEEQLKSWYQETSKAQLSRDTYHQLHPRL